MGGRVAGIGANRLFKRFGRLALLALGRVQNGEIVIGLWHARVLPNQCRKNLDGLRTLLLLGCNHAAHETHFDITGILLEIAVGLRCCLLGIALIQQLRHFIHSARSMGGHAAQEQTTQQHGQHRP